MFSRRKFNIFSIAAVAATSTALISQRGAASDAAKRAFPVEKSDDEWRKVLTKEQYYVLREHGTERAFTSPLDKIYSAGDYQCAGCGAPLFTSDTKFNSGTGWPSFFKPVEKAVGTRSDWSFFMARNEVHCATCGGHLGHVFPDGPAPTGQRYCMNGVALKFVPKADPAAAKVETKS